MRIALLVLAALLLVISFLRMVSAGQAFRKIEHHPEEIQNTLKLILVSTSLLGVMGVVIAVLLIAAAKNPTTFSDYRAAWIAIIGSLLALSLPGTIRRISHRDDARINRALRGES